MLKERDRRIVKCNDKTTHTHTALPNSPELTSYIADLTSQDYEQPS